MSVLHSSRIIATAILCACLGLAAHSTLSSYASQTRDSAGWTLGAAVAESLSSCTPETCTKDVYENIEEKSPGARILWVENGEADEFGISRGLTISFDTKGEMDETPSPELAEDVNAAATTGKGYTKRISDNRIRAVWTSASDTNRTVVVEMVVPDVGQLPNGIIWALGAAFFALLGFRSTAGLWGRLIPLLVAGLAIGVGVLTKTEMTQTLSDQFTTLGQVLTGAGLFWNATLTTTHVPFEAIAFGILVGGILAAYWVPSMTGFVEDLRTQPSVYAYVTPAVISTIILVFVPFMAGIGLAFFHAGPGDPSKYVFAGMDNFMELLRWDTSGGGANTFQFTTGAGEVYFTAPKFYFTLAVTVIWTLLNVFLHLAIGLGLALILNRPKLRFKKLYRVLLIVPWAVPSYITALTWKMMFHTEYGTVNHVLEALGSTPIDWLGSGDTFAHFASNFTANLATNTWLGFPFMMVVSLGALQSIPSELYEAASIDGATRVQKFKLITLPLLKPALLPAVLLGSIWTFNMFNVVYLVSGGAPFDKTNILITEAFRFFHASKDYGMAAAYSVVIFLILLGYASVTNRVTKATEGALK